MGSNTGPIQGNDSVAEAAFKKPHDSASALGEVIATAIVTAAVVPFVQALVKKAGEDTYTGVRTWLKKLFQDSKARREVPGQRRRELLVVQELDPKLNLWLYMPTDASDVALRSLDQLDVAAEVERAKRGKVAKIRIYWDERSGQWRTDG